VELVSYIQQTVIIDKISISLINLQNFSFVTAFLIFIAYFFADALYAYYTLSVLSLKPYTSATVGALMYFLLAFGIINYVNNYLYLIPLVLGSWLGTFIVVSVKKHFSSKHS